MVLQVVTKVLEEHLPLSEDEDGMTTQKTVYLSDFQITLLRSSANTDDGRWGKNNLLLQNTFECHQIFLKIFQQTYHSVCIVHKVFWNMIHVGNKEVQYLSAPDQWYWHTTVMNRHFQNPFLTPDIRHTVRHNPNKLWTQKSHF